MKNNGWHITNDNIVKKCSATFQACHYKKHFRSEALALKEAKIITAFQDTAKVVRDNKIRTTSSPILENVEFVQKRPPQIYAFTVPELADGLHATKVGDTTRGVEVRLREWKQKGGIYENLKLEFNLDASFEDSNGETVYVRDYNFHVWLKNNGYQALTEILDEYPHLKEAPEGISQEFYFNKDDRELKITEEMLKRSLKHQKDTYGKPSSPYAYYTEVRGQQVSSHYAPVNDYEMRPFQAAIVKKATKYFNSTEEKDPQFLLSAPTRSGKSFMAANTVSQLFASSPKKNNCVVVVSGFAEIEDEWKGTFESHKKFAREDGTASENKCGKSPCECRNRFKYLSVADLRRDKNAVENAYKEGYDNVAVFLTLQDLSGSTKEDDATVKEVHTFLQKENSVDFLIGDEAHFAMFSDGRYQDSIKQTISDEEDDALLDEEVSSQETEEIGKLLGTMNPTQGKLFVTATPYNNVPWGTKYNQSVNAAVIRESDIRKEKEAWDIANAMKDEPAAEWANPSYGLPDKKMFGVDVGMSPNELFRMSGTKFANQKAVREFIQGFFGAAPGESKIPNFFGSKEFADAGLGNHIYATLPSRKACDAFEAELNQVFKERGVDGYEVLNISSSKPRHLTSKKRAAEIKDEITQHAEAGRKTITVTCNRMGTGVTQEYWDTVLLLRTMSSAQQFQQTAGRPGTPRVSSRNNISEKVRANRKLCRNCEKKEIRAVGTYLCETCFNRGGAELEEAKKDRTLKHVEKPNVAVISLDPGQLVKIRQEAILTDIVDDPETVSSEEVDRITDEELNAVPLYIVGGDEMKLQKVTASNIMDHFLAHLKGQGVMEMVSDLKLDLSRMTPELEESVNEKYSPLEEGSKIFETGIAEGDFRSHLSQNYCIRGNCSEPVRPGLTSNGDPYRLCEEHYDEAKRKREQQEEGVGDSAEQVESEAEKEYQKTLEGKIRTAQVSALLYAVLSRVELTGVDSIVKSTKKYAGSRRLARHLDLDIGIVESLRSSGVAGIDLDNRIKFLNNLTRTTSLNEAWEHLTIALNSFKKFSDNEIPTPEPVADELTAALKAGKRDWERVAVGTGVIDIGSKSAITLLKSFNEAAAHGVNIGDKLWSVPTSGKTYELTRSVYLAHGWDENKIIFHDNLENMETAKLVHLLQEENGCKASNPAECPYHSSREAGKAALKSELKTIRDKMNDETCYRKLKKLMKDTGRFDYCISNPPYQKAPTVKTQNRSQEIYSDFIELGSKLSDVSVMIHPIKAFKRIPNIPSPATRSIMNSKEFTVEMVENDWRKYFPSVDLKGGIMITRFERGSDNHTEWDSLAVPETAYEILKKVRAVDTEAKPMSDSVFSAYYYSAETIKKHKIKKSRYIESNHPDTLKDILLSEPPTGEDYVTVYGRSANQRIVRYARKADIEGADSAKVKGYKILIPGGMGNGRFGAKTSETTITKANSVATRTFKNIGPFRTKSEAVAADKYMKTRFSRMLLSTLKITQNTPEHVFENIPQQDFTSKSSIDWTQSIAGIDKQLAVKYGLTAEEVEWMNKNIEEMR